MKKEEAIAWAGSGAELARRLGVKPQAVYQWGNSIPLLREFQINEMKQKVDLEKNSQ